LWSRTGTALRRGVYLRLVKFGEDKLVRKDELG